MVTPVVYIDGQEGTTGLRIRQMLADRNDIDLILIPKDKRKSNSVRADFLNEADIAVLCLPDDAASEALGWIENASVKVIDTSTVRRIDSQWTYGLPEINSSHRESIINSNRVANPGCYPVSFILALRPLIETGLLSVSTPLAVNAVSGYSGGGRKMIEDYRLDPDRMETIDAHKPLSLYGLNSTHKHIAEMQKFALIDQAPIFVPSVAHTFCGMTVSIPIPAVYLCDVNVDKTVVHNIWRDAYKNSPMVRLVDPLVGEETLRHGFLDMETFNHQNEIELSVWGDERGLILIGRLDNLGKGASGNAVQCLNLMLGIEETTGLL